MKRSPRYGFEGRELRAASRCVASGDLEHAEASVISAAIGLRLGLGLHCDEVRFPKVTGDARTLLRRARSELRSRHIMRALRATSAALDVIDAQTKVRRRRAA